MPYNYLNLIEDKLSHYMDIEDDSQKEIFDSMKYSLMAGGKRIRPILTFEFCRLCGGNIEDAVPFACAVEMIHTYSLIHDDLPCMDNDDFRRGKPSNHKVYGENIALLAGDALISLAFETMLSSDVNSDIKAKASLSLAKASGAKAMVLGQVIDIKSENKKIDLDLLKMMDEKKTGALISSACEIGCIVGNGTDDKIKSAVSFGDSIGLAYQIVDDILDVVSSKEELGKPIKSDENSNKSTYVSILGIDKSRKLVDKLTQEAIKSLDKFDEDTSYLKDLALKLTTRRK